MKWDAKTGVLWRTSIDAESWSSPILASMAVSGGLLFIRTDTALYAIGEAR